VADSFQEILRKIPGFGGYLAASARRESEAKARQWVAQHLETGKRAIDSFAKKLADAGQFDSLPKCDRIRGQLDLLISRMRSTPLGHGGFFTESAVDDDTLEDLYEYDLWLMDEAEKLAKSVQLTAAGGNSAEVLQQLEQQVNAMETKWRDRQKLIEGDD
jgi:hypothetical protein